MRFFSRRPTSTSSRRAASIGAVVAGSRTGSFKTDNGNDNDNNDILGQKGQGDRPPAVDGSPDEESLATKGGEGYRDIEGATVYGQAGKPGGEEGAVTPSAKVAMLEVEGMTCVVCVGIVENLLQRVPGVESAEVNLPMEKATIVYNPEITTPEKLVDAVEDGGYEAKMHIDDEEGEGKEGINHAQEKTAKMKAATRSARNLFLVSLLFSVPVVVISMGFHGDSGGVFGRFLNKSIVPGLLVRTVLEWVLTTPVQFGCGASFYRASWYDMRNRALGMNFLVASGTSAAYLYSVVLVALAISKKENPPMLFFETSAVLVSFVLLGKFLKQLARGRASNAVGKLMDLRADRAVLVSDWPACELKGEVDMDASELAVGDVVKVVRGSKIPADGAVLRGNAAVDESMVTGESMPVYKGEGSDVIGATVCIEGLVYVRVTRIGKASALQQIIRLVEQAQGTKAPIQEVGDRVAGVFVPCVACLSLLTLAVWLTLTLSGIVPESWYRDLTGSPGPALFSFMFALSVMVIACPCAVGLAAPTAILVGTGMSAHHGVLIKGGAALQRVSELKRVVFDKTGTLTVGKPRVTEVAYLESESLQKALSEIGMSEKGEWNAPDEVLRLIASAERSSEHPLAKAIVEFHSLESAKARREAGVGGASTGADPSQELEMPAEGSIVTVSGRGLSCTVAGFEVSVGSPSYIEKVTGKPLTSLPELAAGCLESSGRTVVVATIDGHPAALFGLVDTLRPEARQVVSELRRMGLEVWMLTGDNRRAAHEVARRVGLPTDRVCAEVLPGDKASKVEELQKDGKAVAMVGDGINDAPALATADVGIAVGGGTDVAVESADVVLMGSSLWDVLISLDLSRAIVNRVRANYFWAFLYNTIALPVAAGVFFPALKIMLPPEIAGGTMALSSVSVLLSSLALRLYRPPLAARKAIRAAARSAKELSLLTKGVEDGQVQFDSATVWTVDMACNDPCCRDAIAVELGAINNADSGLQGHKKEAELSKQNPGFCCFGSVSAAAVGKSRSDGGGNDELPPTPGTSVGGSGVVPGGGTVAWTRCGDLEQGKRGCPCACSFCRCVRAVEP